MQVPAPTQPQMQMSSPDVVEAGRVLATLPTLWGILFMAALIIVFLLIFTIWREVAMQSERKLMMQERSEMKQLAKSFADSAMAGAQVMSEVSAKMTVLSLLAAQVETVKQDKPNG
jgi:hypothetical protein